MSIVCRELETAMTSECRVNLNEPEVGTPGDQGGPSSDPVTSPSSEASGPDLQSLLPAGAPSSADIGPSLSAEPSGLLSLPWEMVTHIASHLPAQCVIAVLPKVCHALGNVGKDNTAWQLRAHRLIGSRTGFPVGPREDFDWPSACLEMEQLITCWTGQARLMARQTKEEAADNREDDCLGAEAQEDVYDEGMEVAMDGDEDEMQPIVGGDLLARLREGLEERLEDDAAALMAEERGHRMVFGAHLGPAGALNHQENLADPRNLGNRRPVEMEQRQPLRSPSPPPPLECTTLPSDHIAPVNAVLLVGGEGAVCATGSRDWNVKLWDLQAGSGGALRHTVVGRGGFSSHRGWVWCLASQGPLLASGGFDSTVRLWDLQAGGAERGLIKSGAAVHCLSFRTDVLLAGTFDRRISMYDTRAADPLVKSLRLHGNAVMCLAADDKYIISGSKDCTVVVYDRRADRGLKKLRLSSYLLSMSYSGSEIWAGDHNGMLHSFSMQAGSLKPLSQFDVGHTALLTGIHRSPGSLYTCSSDRTVKLSVEAGVLAVATGNVYVDVWRPRT
ncbi:F-box/WD repeat-containing protein 9 [Liparis tanakae]|uniref:F-box/WD repeat-containing protein 9 n=1 Tax=Liparis tanakae TaxID=230148 RepID=A0A4Z2IRG0_9TELE|nr:F-box/WD repeat-containing protein 9 [Liparis tanakae]